MLLNKNKLDVAQTFLVFVSLVGDVDRTAAALDLDPEVVQKLADAEGWHTKIQRVSLLAKSGKPGDHNRSMNRALAFVQGHRIRSLIDKVVTRFAGMDEDEICAELAVPSKYGKLMSARFFTDLAAAAEKANALCFSALGDTAGERSERGADHADDMNTSALHAAVIASLNASGSAVKPAEQIVRELAEETQRQIDTQVCQNDTSERTQVEPRPISGTDPAAPDAIG